MSELDQRHYIFWQNMLSPHQRDFLVALAARPDARVTLVVQQAVDEQRMNMGWEEPDLRGLEVVVSPSEVDPKAFLEPMAASSARPVCVFSGIRSFPLVWRALRRVGTTDAMVGLYLEHPNRIGRVRMLLKRLRYIWDFRFTLPRIDFVLATGQRAIDWYRACGISGDKLFEFGYFVDVRDEGGDAGKAVEPVPTVAFAGQLIPRKAPMLLAQALSGLAQLPWQLLVVGEGGEKHPLKAYLDEQRLGDRVRWSGFCDHAHLMAELRTVDVLVLPSHDDGWGVVINEALLNGARVIASDACGAADLVAASGYGRVFPAGDLGALREALRAELALGTATPTQRQHVSEWAGAAIGGEAAAQYFVDIVVAAQEGKGRRPVPPWRRVADAIRGHVTS